jgi:1-acyl-sn-glycerol-3-phosphate acyltransferase
MHELKYSTLTIFAILGCANFVVSIYIYSIIPEFFLRFVVWISVHILYRVRAKGVDNIPHEGPALLICNHVSFIDWFIIAGVIPRPVRFVMDHRFMKIPVLRYFFKNAKVIPIASKKEDPQIMERAFEIVAQELRAGELVCIFPEGKLTRDGNLNPFRPGIERILKTTPVPVVPMVLKGLWGSFFSHKEGLFRASRPRPFFYRVHLEIEKPVPPDKVTAASLQSNVETMLQ